MSRFSFDLGVEHLLAGYAVVSIWLIIVVPALTGRVQRDEENPLRQRFNRAVARGCGLVGVILFALVFVAMVAARYPRPNSEDWLAWACAMVLALVLAYSPLRWFAYRGGLG